MLTPAQPAAAIQPLALYLADASNDNDAGRLTNVQYPQ